MKQKRAGDKAADDTCAHDREGALYEGAVFRPRVPGSKAASRQHHFRPPPTSPTSAWTKEPRALSTKNLPYPPSPRRTRITSTHPIPQHTGTKTLTTGKCDTGGRYPSCIRGGQRPPHGASMRPPLPPWSEEHTPQCRTGQGTEPHSCARRRMHVLHPMAAAPTRQPPSSPTCGPA